MTAAAVTSAAVLAAAELPATVAELAGCSFSPLSDDDVLEVLRLAERARRQLEALDHVLIAELEARNLPGRYVLRGSKQLLSGLLTLSPSESGTRVRHAHELGPRTGLTGERLPPLLPITAAARADGAITSRQAEVIIQSMAKLRSIQLPVEEQSDAESFLVEQARRFDAATLAGIAKRLLDTLDPDGNLAEERSQRRRRFLSCVPNGNGMHRLTAELDTETAALAMAVLHALAAPKPPANGEHDERTAGQRMHDAFRSVLKLALRAGGLRASGGIPATVLITMTAEQFQTGTGLAATSYGQKLSVDRALRLADQAAIAWIVHNSKGGIINYGTTRRVASDKQTLALIARDKGCAFPGCADPPEWTERHHIVPWREGGPTDLDNLCLLCDFHHDRIDTGWQITMRDDVPWFVPPAWLDPDQRPQRNVRP
jgi:hypothetical protein